MKIKRIKDISQTPLIIYLILMIAISVTAINSAIPLTKLNYPKILNPNFALKQFIFIGLGGIITIIIIIIGSEIIRAFRWWIYTFCMIPLIGLLIHQYLFEIPFAIDRNGAYSWYEFGGNTIQPSEFMKIGIVLVVADLIQTHNECYSHLTRNFKTDFKLLLKIMAAVLPPAVCIFVQPDSGITMIILFFVALMIFASGIQWRYILTLCGIIIIGVVIFILLVSIFPEFLTEVLNIQLYKLNRFYGWFDPFGTIQTHGNQLAKGLLAMGSGGLSGNGFQSSTIYFPEAHTDFIFAVIGMDFGLIGTLITVLLCGLFDFEILNIAEKNRGHYNAYVCIGVFGMLFFQQIQNIGMIIGLLPITGITLPFISYGGSSSISYMILFGLILCSYLDGVKIKHNDIEIYEKTLYLKTKPFIK